MDKNFIEDRLISGNMLPDDAEFLLYLTNTNIIDYESKSIIERYADRLIKIKGNTNTFVYSKDYLLDIKKNKGIIDNVILFGLRGRTESLLSDETGEEQ